MIKLNRIGNKLGLAGAFGILLAAAWSPTDDDGSQCGPCD